MAKVGNPEKTLTDQQLIQLESLAAYLSQDQIADYFGINRDTLAAMIKREQRIEKAYRKGRALAIEGQAQSLIQQGRNGNVKALMFYLSAQAGWTVKTQQDHTSSDRSMSPTQNLSDLELEQQIKLKLTQLGELEK